MLHGIGINRHLNDYTIVEISQLNQLDGWLIFQAYRSHDIRQKLH